MISAISDHLYAFKLKQEAGSIVMSVYLDELSQVHKTDRIYYYALRHGDRVICEDEVYDYNFKLLCKLDFDDYFFCGCVASPHHVMAGHSQYHVTLHQWSNESRKYK